MDYTQIVSFVALSHIIAPQYFRQIGHRGSIPSLQSPRLPRVNEAAPASSFFKMSKNRASLCGPVERRSQMKSYIARPVLSFVESIEDFIRALRLYVMRVTRVKLPWPASLWRADCQVSKAKRREADASHRNCGGHYSPARERPQFAY